MLAALWDFLRSIFVFAGCVHERSGLPKKLDPSEEERLTAILLGGDEKDRAAVRDTLIEHNLRLVAHIAKKYRHGRDIDDLISIGSIGLIKAVNTFSPSRGKSLAAYAGRCIENEILMALRQERKRTGEVSLEEPIGCDRDGNEITVGDVLSAEGDVAEDVERRIDIERMRRVVDAVRDEREKQVIILRFGLDGGDPLPQREVGKRLGISRSYVSRIEKKALEGLQKALSREGLPRMP